MSGCLKLGLFFLETLVHFINFNLTKQGNKAFTQEHTTLLLKVLILINSVNIRVSLLDEVLDLGIILEFIAFLAWVDYEHA